MSELNLENIPGIEKGGQVILDLMEIISTRPTLEDLRDPLEIPEGQEELAEANSYQISLLLLLLRYRDEIEELQSQLYSIARVQGRECENFLDANNDAGRLACMIDLVKNMIAMTVKEVAIPILEERNLPPGGVAFLREDGKIILVIDKCSACPLRAQADAFGGELSIALANGSDAILPDKLN